MHQYWYTSFVPRPKIKYVLISIKTKTKKWLPTWLLPFQICQNLRFLLKWIRFQSLLDLARISGKTAFTNNNFQIVNKCNNFYLNVIIKMGLTFSFSVWQISFPKYLSVCEVQKRQHVKNSNTIGTCLHILRTIGESFTFDSKR